MLTNISLSALLSLFCLLGLAFGVYLEHSVGLHPCPLCWVQRFFYGTAGLCFAWTAWRASKAALWGGIVSVFLGGAVAAQQIHIQSMLNPPSCTAGIEYLFATFPLWEFMLVLLRGTADCAEVTWRFLGLSLAEWSLGAFGVLLLGGLYVLSSQGYAGKAELTHK